MVPKITFLRPPAAIVNTTKTFGRRLRFCSLHFTITTTNDLDLINLCRGPYTEMFTEQVITKIRIVLIAIYSQDSDDEMETDETTEGNQPFVAHVPVPSQKEVCLSTPLIFNKLKKKPLNLIMDVTRAGKKARKKLEP